MTAGPQAYRSGFVSFVGRPNAGKSTLTNAMVGQKVVITSDKPQTTRTVVRGIVQPARRAADPGRHPGPAPAAHAARRAPQRPGQDDAGPRSTSSRCASRPTRRSGPGDRFIVTELAKVRRTIKVAVATKTDLATPEQIGQHLLDIAVLGESTGTTWAEVVPVSAVSGSQVDLLADLLVGMLPEGPQLYPDGDLTDAPEEILAAELIREAALDGVRDELPHSIAVVVEEMGLREGRPADKPLLDIHANLYVERVLAEGHHHRPPGLAAARGRHPRPQADRGLARHPRLPRPPRQDRQGLAARPQAAPQAGVLRRTAASEGRARGVGSARLSKPRDRGTRSRRARRNPVRDKRADARPRDGLASATLLDQRLPGAQQIP